MELTLYVGPGSQEAFRKAVVAARRDLGTWGVVEVDRLDRAGSGALERFAGTAASRHKVFATTLDGATKTGINAALRAIEEGPGTIYLASTKPPMLTVASRAVKTVRCPCPTPAQIEAAGLDPDVFEGGPWPTSIANAHTLADKAAQAGGARDRAAGLVSAATRGDRSAIRAHVVSFDGHEAESLVAMARGAQRGQPPLSPEVGRAVLGMRHARPRVLASATAELVMVEVDMKRRQGVR